MPLDDAQCNGPLNSTPELFDPVRHDHQNENATARVAFCLVEAAGIEPASANDPDPVLHA